MDTAKSAPNVGREVLYTGSQIIIESLLRNGVEVVFGYPGGSVIPLYDEMLAYEGRLRHVLVRHEQGAVHAAQGYARTTGRPALLKARAVPPVDTNSNPRSTRSRPKASRELLSDTLNNARSVPIVASSEKW